MELSIAYELYLPPHRMPTRTAMELVRAAGFRTVDLSVGPFCLQGEQPFLQDSWRESAEQMRQCAEEVGLATPQAHCLLFDFWNAPREESERMTNINLHLMDVCDVLGVEYFVLHPGTVAGAVSKRESLEATMRWLEPFVEKAEKGNVKICVENVFQWVGDHVVPAFGANPDELAELVDRIGSRKVGICWDTGHAHIGRLDQRKALNLLGERVWTTHLHDNRGQMSFDLHLPPFYGSIDWNSVMQGLKEIGYRGTLNFEIEPHTVPEDFMLEEFRSVYAKGERLLKMLEE